MKRKYYLLVLFLIAVCLLSFVGISYLDEGPIKTPGEFWNRFVNLDNLFNVSDHDLSDIIKKSFIKGFGEGVRQTLGLIGNDPGDKAVVIYDYSQFILKHIDEIKGIMDDLYKDPANTNITIGRMCDVAADKLQGKDVEDLIRDYRIFGLIPGF